MKRLIAVVALMMAALQVGLLGLRAAQASRERQARAAILDAARPVSLRNCTLARVGSANDGGYLMCVNLDGAPQSAYSYGVGPNDEWGCAVSTRYRVPVHQYDCFDPARPSCATGRFVFHNECLAGRREVVDSRTFDTLSNQVARNGDRGKRLIVKIDVEGAEWEALLATPDAVLAQIDQLPMELHLPRGDFRDDATMFLRVLDKLSRHFVVANLHFNNNTCAAEAAPLPGWVFQVLLVNRRLAQVVPGAARPAVSPLNAPDNPAKAECRGY
ncbi:MAG TPA: hypothetical protein VFD69_01475 [Vicinamibacterales bacterium]|nr:hypothetical protein [Vicinamibacterales bacterium]